MNEYIQIGKLAASVGLKGEIILEHNFGKKTDLKGLQAIFVEDAGKNLLPYFVQGAKAKSHNEVIVKLEGVDVVEVARKLTPKAVWLTREDAAKFVAKDSALNLLGYMLFDNKTEVGEIVEVIELPHQLTVAVMHKGVEALVPLHRDNLINIDHKGKKVVAELPDKLLEVYLNPQAD